MGDQMLESTESGDKPWDRGEKPPSGNGGADPPGPRPTPPVGLLALCMMLISLAPAAGRGRPARTRASAPPSAQSASAVGFSWDFAGRRPIQTGSKNHPRGLVGRTPRLAGRSGPTR